MIIDDKQFASQMALVDDELIGIMQERKVDELYYQLFPRDGAQEVVVISHGYTETCEKFFEMVYYFHQAGYHVAALDHRGHGRSLRLVGHPSLVDVEQFQDYIDDFDLFLTKVVNKTWPGLNYILYAHSMGGAIGMNYLMQHPTVFSKAIFSTPMWGVRTNGVPKPLVKAIIGTMKLLGRSKQRVFTEKKYTGWEDFETGPCDSKPRFDYYQKKKARRIAFQTSAPTYQWLEQCLSVTSMMQSSAIFQDLDLPCLVFKASRDTFVENRAIDLIAGQLPNAKLVEVDSKHEIYQAENAVLEPYVEEILAFLRRNTCHD